MSKSFCRACTQTFTSVKVFDLHRTGSFTHKIRRCMTEEEMRARGLIQNKKGWWTTAASEKAPWARRRKELAATSRSSP